MNAKKHNYYWTIRQIVDEKIGPWRSRDALVRFIEENGIEGIPINSKTSAYSLNDIYDCLEGLKHGSNL